MYKKLIILYLIVVSGILFSCPAVQGADEASDKNIDKRTLSLNPVAEPVPALTYQLLPRYLYQKNRNAALFYYAAAGLCPNGDSEGIHEKIRQWRDLPVDQLNRKEVEKALSSFSICFNQIKLASQCNHCQWDMPLEEGFSMQIPQLLTYRQIIMAMQLQIRLNIADGQIGQALEMLQEGFYMGRSIAEGHTIVQGLVGIAIEAVMLKEIENLIQTQNSPNLYWALTSLPDPLIDLHSSLQYEREVLFLEFPQLLDLENQVLTPAQVFEIISDIINKLQSLDSDMNEFPLMNFMPVGWVMMHYPDAKKHLASKGYSKEQIEAIPTAQAVLIYQIQQYMEMTDNMYKWFEMPYYQSQFFLIESEQQFTNSSVSQGIKANIFSFFLPSLYRVAFMQARLDRNIAILRTIEAIRIFAADNTKQLPETLSEITKVPIPIDPVTGEDFIYHRLNSTTARLEAPVSPEESGNRPVYELNIKP